MSVTESMEIGLLVKTLAKMLLEGQSSLREIELREARDGTTLVIRLANPPPRPAPSPSLSREDAA